jgi:TDG/mug DNA glycosylase family protein
LPLALAHVHWATSPGDVVELDLPAARDEQRLDDIVAGAGFERGRGRDGERFRRVRTLADTVGPGMRMLVCGLNPSEVAADAGFGFAGATNRFWPAAAAAGLVSSERDPLHALSVDGVGMTDLVKRATPGTRDLRPDEYRAGAERVARLVRWLRPGVVLFVGLEGWRAAIDRHATAGWAADFGGRPAYVMPSTSGLNAHARLADLVDHMRAALVSKE